MGEIHYGSHDARPRHRKKSSVNPQTIRNSILAFALAVGGVSGVKSVIDMTQKRQTAGVGITWQDLQHATPAARQSESDPSTWLPWDESHPNVSVDKTLFRLSEQFKSGNRYKFPFNVYIDPAGVEKYREELAARGWLPRDVKLTIEHTPREGGIGEGNLGDPFGRTYNINLSLPFLVDQLVKPQFKGQDLNDPHIQTQFVQRINGMALTVSVHETGHYQQLVNGEPPGNIAEATAVAAEKQSNQFTSFLIVKPLEGFDYNNW